MSEPVKPKTSFVTKVGGYAAKRFMPTASQGVARKFGEGSIRGAMSAMQPKTYVADEFKAGLEGRYADRGAARFKELMKKNNLGEAELQALEKQNFVLTTAYGLTSIALLIFSLYCVVVAEGFYDYVLAFANFCAFLALASLTVRHDFNRWQILQRGFPGFRAYLDERW